MKDVLLIADLHGQFGKIDSFLELNPEAVFIAGNEQSEDQETPPVDPGQHAREVHRADLRPDQAIEDHHGGERDHRQLHRESSMSPLQESAQDR